MHPSRGVRLGRPFGVPVLAHVSWLPTAALLVTYLSVTSFGPYELPVAAGLAGLTAVGVLGSLVLHELAHIACAKRLGISLQGVILYPVGGVPRLPAGPPAPGPHAAYAMAGPVASAALAGVLWWTSTLVSSSPRDVLVSLAAANAAVAGLNLLPAYPLDAGRLVASGLSARRGPLGAMASAARLGVVLGVLLLAVGIGLFVGGSARIGASDGLLVALAGLFVLPLARTAGRAARVAEALDGQTAADWTQPFAGRIAPDARVPRGAGPFAVSEDGRLAGVLVRGGGRRAVHEVMIPWRTELSCAQDTPLTSAVERLAALGAGVLVVLDADGVVRGVLSEDEVRRRLSPRRR